METQSLPIDLIQVDSDTQSRLQINMEIVMDYAEVIEKHHPDWPFPPLDVFRDDEDHWMADGFHRGMAAKEAGRSSVPCRIHEGTAIDARIFGMTANDTHGLRMTRADKRACVEWLLDGHAGELTREEIADKAGVTVRTVRNIVAERKHDEQEPHLSDDNFIPPGGDDDDDPFDVDPFDVAIEDPKPPRQQEPVDRGKCPNCSGTDWDEDEDGTFCAKCNHPWGEPAGDVDDDQLSIQKSKARKTVEAAMRAFDDLNAMQSSEKHDRSIEVCKELLTILQSW